MRNCCRMPASGPVPRKISTLRTYLRQQIAVDIKEPTIANTGMVMESRRAQWFFGHEGPSSITCFIKEADSIDSTSNARILAHHGTGIPIPARLSTSCRPCDKNNQLTTYSSYTAVFAIYFCQLSCLYTLPSQQAALDPTNLRLLLLMIYITST